MFETMPVNLLVFLLIYFNSLRRLRVALISVKMFFTPAFWLFHAKTPFTEQVRRMRIGWGKSAVDADFRINLAVVNLHITA